MAPHDNQELFLDYMARATDELNRAVSLGCGHQHLLPKPSTERGWTGPPLDEGKPVTPLFKPFGVPDRTHEVDRTFENETRPLR